MAQTFTSTDVVSTTNVFADNQSQRTNENTLRSTFSGTTQPSDPVVGQQWYDTANSKTMQYNGTTWVPIDTNGTTQIDVSNAKGALTSLTSYLRVAHNDDGTLKSSPATAIDEFKDNALVITYLSPTSFTVPSDLTSIFTANRKVKVYLSASTAISYVTSSTFSTVTTVTLGSAVLDATVTAVKYSIIQEGMPQDYSLALAESTGYGIVSGCAPSINGLTVTVASGVIHLADGMRKEVSASTVVLSNADSTNPRIDVVYITSAGAIAKVTGTAAASPSVPSVPSGGIFVALVSLDANATTGGIVDTREVIARWYNTGVISVNDFGAIGDGVTDDTAAIQKAVDVAIRNKKLLTAEAGAVYAVSSPINIKGLLFSNWNMVTIKAIGSVTSVVNLDDSYRFQPWYGSVENLQIDCNGMADCGLLITSGLKKTIRNITVVNVNGIGIKHQGGYEVLGENWQVEGDGVSKTSVGVMFTGDSYYHNIIVIDCYTAVSGSTSTSRVENLHAWIKTPSLYAGSTFWYIPYDGLVNASHVYSDTYEYSLRFKGTAAHTYIDELEILYNSSIVPSKKINDTVYFLYFDDPTGKLYTRDIILNGVVYAEVPANKKFTNIEGFCGEVYQFHRKNVYAPLVTLPPTIYNVNADNLLLNSNFAIAQRGTSQSGLGINSMDRWNLNGNVTSATMERASCSLTGAQYENKISLNISGSGNWCELQQVVENGINVIVGMPVTVSFWVKCSTDATVAVKLRQVGGSVDEIGSLNKPVGTNWQFVETTFYFNDSPFTATQQHLLLVISLLNSGVYEIANVKMEVNKKASRYNPPNETAEIIKCQRYFQRHTLCYYGDFAMGDSHDKCAYLPTFYFSKMYTTPQVTVQPSSEQFGVVESNQPSQGVGWLTSDCTLSATRVTTSSFAPKITSNSYNFGNTGYKALMSGVRTVWLSADL